MLCCMALFINIIPHQVINHLMVETSPSSSLDGRNSCIDPYHVSSIPLAPWKLNDKLVEIEGSWFWEALCGNLIWTDIHCSWDNSVTVTLYRLKLYIYSLNWNWTSILAVKLLCLNHWTIRPLQAFLLFYCFSHQVIYHLMGNLESYSMPITGFEPISTDYKTATLPFELNWLIPYLDMI